MGQCDCHVTNWNRHEDGTWTCGDCGRIVEPRHYDLRPQMPLASVGHLARLKVAAGRVLDGRTWDEMPEASDVQVS